MKYIFTLTLVMLLGLSGCSKDNPVNPIPAYVGTYNGNIDIGDTVSITISNVGGAAYLTSYSISYHYNSGGSGGSGTYSATDTDGIVQLINGAFEVSLSSDPEEKISGTFSSETELNGTYKVKPADSYLTGSFSATK